MKIICVDYEEGYKDQVENQPAKVVDSAKDHTYLELQILQSDHTYYVGEYDHYDHSKSHQGVTVRYISHVTSSIAT